MDNKKISNKLEVLIEGLSIDERKSLYHYLGESLGMDKPLWAKCEEVVAASVGGKLAKTTQKGFDIITDTGVRYQVKQKAIFNNDLTRNSGGRVYLSNFEFDILVIVGTTIDGRIVECRTWEVNQVKEYIGARTYFNITTTNRFETGKLLDI